MPNPRRYCVITIFMVVTFALSGCRPSPAPTRADTQTAFPSTSDIPYNLISADRMLADLEELTTIRLHNGFRTAGTAGEVEALEYVEAQLGKLATLKDMGLELERQSFDIYVTTEIHGNQLFLTPLGGVEVEVPANGMRGSRYKLENALYFDTDGILNDTGSNRLTTSGETLLVRESNQLFDLTSIDVAGKILFLDEHLVDAFSNNLAIANRQQVFDVIDMAPSGIVFVSEYSNRDGASHASMLGDGTFFQNSIPKTRVPILFSRIEDIQEKGFINWDGLATLKSARIMLDSDVISPAPSQNLIARIPGKDPSKAMIVSAHIDSPNGPGGFDDGSGSAIALELARVLNEVNMQPDVDLYLVWYGSHENGLYGSAWFAETHADVLDKAIAQLQIDCLGMPMEGHTSNIVLNFNSYARFGNAEARWQNYLTAKSASLNIPVKVYDDHGLIADNSNFDTWNVPEADMLYFNTDDLEAYGNGYIHYSNHWHDAYETVDVVSQVKDVMVDMAKVALTAAIQTGRDAPQLRTVTPSGKRALFIASHTQPASMMTSLRELGMALAYEGFDVDPIPYGQPVTPADLKDVGIVVLLPTYDYPGVADETWSQGELDALKAYVDSGGLLVVTNSAIGHIMTVPISDPNEDELDINVLLESFGVAFEKATYTAEMAKAAVSIELTQNAQTLLTYGSSGVTFVLDEGQVLYESHGQPIVALVGAGKHGGQVLVIGDLGLLIDNGNGINNLQFLRNLAAYARDR